MRARALRGLPFVLVIVGLLAPGSHAYAAPAPHAVPNDDAFDDAAEDEALDDGEPVPNREPLTFRGYVDVGYAKAQGDGTSYAPNDTRLPADYRVDTFAPAVNSFGDVAATDAGKRFVNGFLPTTTGQGGKGSFLLNVLSLDTRYEPEGSPLTIFARVQLFPRYLDGQEQSRLWVEQAFGRLQPFASKEFTITLGKLDSVFGIEYLENQSNFRTGVTPSLFARYTTGRGVGAKVFFRQQIPALWSALSLNVSATNSGTFVEALQPTSRSLTGTPVLAARLGYEFNHPRVGVKLGASGLYGPRNDQTSAEAEQRMFGVDARLFLLGLALSGEYIDVRKGLGADTGKYTGLGVYPLASGFEARGFYAQAAYVLRVGWRALSNIVPYGRYERRRAAFEGFGSLTVDRLTAGLRLDFWESLLVKVEFLRNRELAGALPVNNDVLTSSVVFSW